MINKMNFTPISRFFKSGNEIQICKTMYKNIEIQWTTYFPFNVFKNPIDIFLVDRIVPIDEKIKNAKISDSYYTEEGFGMPEFEKLEDCMEYIDTLS